MSNLKIISYNRIFLSNLYNFRLFFRKYNLTIGDQTYELRKEMLTIKSCTETKHVKEIIPNVIEPSFGIGRIMYSLFEHNFRIREGDENRTVSNS